MHLLRFDLSTRQTHDTFWRYAQTLKSVEAIYPDAWRSAINRFRDDQRLRRGSSSGAVPVSLAIPLPYGWIGWPLLTDGQIRALLPYNLDNPMGTV